MICMCLRLLHVNIYENTCFTYAFACVNIHIHICTYICAKYIRCILYNIYIIYENMCNMRVCMCTS